jgi:uncharacterized membrane protein YgcG
MPTELQELQLRVALINEASEGVGKLRDELKSFSEGTGKRAMDKLKEEQAELAKQVRELGELAVGGGEAMLGYIGKFGVAGVAVASFAGTVGIGLGNLKLWADKIVDLANKAKVIGMHPAELKSIIEQYERLGVSAGVVEQSMAGFSSTIADINRIGGTKRMAMVEAAGQFGEVMEKGIERVEAQTNWADKLNEVLIQSQNVYDNRLAETKGNIADATKSENDFLKLWGLDPSIKVLRNIQKVTEEQKKRQEERDKVTADYKKQVTILGQEWESWSDDIKTSMLASNGSIVSGLKMATDLVKVLHEQWNQPWVGAAGRTLKSLLTRGVVPTAVDLVKAAFGFHNELTDDPGTTFEQRYGQTQAPNAQGDFAEKLKKLGLERSPQAEQPARLLSGPMGSYTGDDQMPGISKGWEWMRRSNNIEDRRQVDDSMRQGDDYVKFIQANTAETKRLNDNFTLLDRGEVALKGLGGLPGFETGSGGGGFGGGGFGGGGATGSWGGDTTITSGTPSGSNVGSGSGKVAGESHPSTGKGGGSPSEAPTGAPADTGESVKGTSAGGVARAFEQRRGEKGEFNYAEKTGALGRPGENLTWITLKNGKKVQVNAAGAEKFKGFFNDLIDRGYKIGSISGYNPRPGGKAGGRGGISEHAFGAAVDVNPGRNQFNGRTTDLPTDVEDMAWAHGVSWGGRFGDPMHFEIMSPEAAKHKREILEARGLLDKTSDKEVRTTKVETGGKLTADVNAPAGSEVKVEGGGAFNKTETNRTMPLQ